MKYCNSCGAQIPDNSAAFCPICGAKQNVQAAAAPTPQVQVPVQPMQNQAVPPTQQPMQGAIPPMPGAIPPAGYNPYAEPKKNKKGLFIALGCGLAVIILAVVIIAVAFSSRGGASSQKALVDNFITCLNKQDSKGFMNLLPDCYAKLIKQEFGSQDIFASFPFNGYKISLGETLDLDIYDQEDIISAENRLYRETNERVVIEEGCDVEYEVILTYEAYNYSDTEELEFSCAKIDGRWYIIDMNF